LAGAGAADPFRLPFRLAARCSRGLIQQAASAPDGVVILGGIATSTALNMLVIRSGVLDTETGGRWLSSSTWLGGVDCSVEDAMKLGPSRSLERLAASHSSPLRSS
jgi:hypothetical protein